MFFRGVGGELQFGERFGDADDGFELADGERDGAAGAGGEFGVVERAAEGDEVGGEGFGGGWGEGGGASTFIGGCRLETLLSWGVRGVGVEGEG